MFVAEAIADFSQNTIDIYSRRFHWSSIDSNDNSEQPSIQIKQIWNYPQKVVKSLLNQDKLNPNYD